MARLFMEHSVEDYAKWRAVYDADHARRDGAGLRQVGVYREAGRPNDLILVWDIDRTVEETRILLGQMMNDPGLQEAMKQAGVKAPPRAWVAD